MNPRPRAAPTFPLPLGEGGPKGQVRGETARFRVRFVQRRGQAVSPWTYRKVGPFRH